MPGTALEVRLTLKVSVTLLLGGRVKLLEDVPPAVPKVTVVTPLLTLPLPVTGVNEVLAELASPVYVGVTEAAV